MRKIFITAAAAMVLALFAGCASQQQVIEYNPYGTTTTDQTVDSTVVPGPQINAVEAVPQVDAAPQVQSVPSGQGTVNVNDARAKRLEMRQRYLDQQNNRR